RRCSSRGRARDRSGGIGLHHRLSSVTLVIAGRCNVGTALKYRVGISIWAIHSRGSAGTVRGRDLSPSQACISIVTTIAMQDFHGFLLASICTNRHNSAARTKFTLVVASFFFWYAHSYKCAKEPTCC